jgi:hypothetical protein
MREVFRDKKKGDPLFAEEVNDLNRVARAFCSETGEGFHGFWRGTPAQRRQAKYKKRYGFTGSGGIPAASLSGGKITPGSASVDEWRWNGTAYVDSGDDVTVRNPWPDAILGDRLISFSLDQDGLLTIDAEACDAFEES